MASDTPSQREELYDRLYASLGSLVSAFVHNLNNCLVGVMGNIDLAGLYSEDPEMSAARITDARKASMAIRDFLTELTRLRPGEGEWTRESFAASAAVAGLACGRAVSLEIDDHSGLPERLPVSDLGFRALMLGILSWAVRSCAGSGTVRVDISTGGGRCEFGICWESPGSNVLPHERSGESFPAWIEPVTGDLGAVLTIGEMNPGYGSMALTFPCEPA